MKILISSICFTVLLFLNIDPAYPQGQTGSPGAQDPCAQYQAQCVNGSSLAGQGAQGGAAAFPNNPIPVGQVNMTAIQQMPYCDAMAQACRAQGTPPTPPSAPGAPPVPEIPAVPAGGGFFGSLWNVFG